MGTLTHAPPNTVGHQMGLVLARPWPYCGRGLGWPDPLPLPPPSAQNRGITDFVIVLVVVLLISLSPLLRVRPECKKV